MKRLGFPVRVSMPTAKHSRPRVRSSLTFHPLPPSDASAKLSHFAARKDLRRMAQPKGFQSGDAVELRVERRGGGIDWVPAQVREGQPW